MWNNFFDKIFLINLKHRVDRLSIVSDELKKYGIQFERYEAVYNKEKGAEGLKETYKKLVNCCLLNGYKNILILEDDVKFLINPNIYIPLCLEQLPIDYFILQLGCNLILPAQKYSDNLLKVQCSYATHAVVYSAEAIKLIYDFLKEESDKALDQLIYKHIQSLGRCFCSYPMIATQNRTKSDIFKYDKQINRGIEKYYDEKNDIINWELLMNDFYAKNSIT